MFLGKLIKVKKNNKGMTLVEVLVAMLIISVAGVSFLQSFSNAATYNSKARGKQDALYLAQTVMEDFKAYGVQDLKRVVTNPTGGSETVFHQAVDNYFTGAISTSITEDATNPDIVTFLASGKYNGNDYSIKAVTSPKVTGAGLVTVQNPNSLHDAFFYEPIEAEQSVVLDRVLEQLINAGDETEEDPTTHEIVTKYPGLKEYVAGYVDSSWLDSTKVVVDSRTMTFKAEEISGSVVLKASVEYQYHIVDYMYYDDNNLQQQLSISDIQTVTFPDAYDSTNDPAGEAAAVYNCFTDGGDASIVLGNLFVYYYPAYANDATVDVAFPCNLDHIVLDYEITDGAPINAFIVKQKLLGVTNTSYTPIDTKYTVCVEKKGAGPVRCYSNLGSNVYDSTASNWEATKTAVDISSVSSVSTNAMKVCYVGFDGTESSHSHGLWLEKTEAVDVTLMYAVELEVLHDGEVVYTLSGSTNAR